MLASIILDAAKDLLRTLGGITLVVLVLGILCKSLLKQLFKKDLEEHKTKLLTEFERVKIQLSADSNTKLEVLKSDLARNHNREIEKFKAQLEIAAHERQTTFESMHKERAETISELYTNMVKAYDAVVILRTIGPPDHVLAQTAKSAVDKFYKTFDAKRIYFTNDICLPLTEINNAMCQAIEIYGIDCRLNQGPTDRQQEALQKLRTLVTTARGSLEQEFRKILGVVNDYPKTEVSPNPSPAPTSSHQSNPPTSS